MAHHLLNVAPPYALPSNIVYFNDWRYIDSGAVQWLDDKDQPVCLMPVPDPLPPTHLNLDLVPRGVRVEAIPPEVAEQPALSAEILREPLLGGGVLVQAEGRYLYYYEGLNPDFIDYPENPWLIYYRRFLRVAESTDGINWSFPQTGSAGYPNTGRGNVVFDPGATGMHGVGVFHDPAAPAEERYKCIFVGILSPEEQTRYTAKWPGDIDPHALKENDPRGVQWGSYAIFGAVSPDGLRWSRLEDPLLISTSDTANVCTYDETRGKYVAFLRGRMFGRRIVVRSESDEFRHFPFPEPLIATTGLSHPDEAWYACGYTRMPGAPDYHLMFNSLYSQMDDSFTPHLFSSPDSATWSPVAGGQLITHGPPGSWYSSGLAIGHLVTLPGQRMGSLANGMHAPHKYPRQFPYGYAGWVSWQESRLTALRADSEGAFSLHPLIVKGQEVHLNFRTRRDGYIKVEVSGVKGRAFEDCDVLSGDEQSRIVTWKGTACTGRGEGEPVHLKFRMQNADLFSVAFK